jgi:hypothetical protein
MHFVEKHGGVVLDSLQMVAVVFVPILQANKESQL